MRRLRKKVVEVPWLEYFHAPARSFSSLPASLITLTYFVHKLMYFKKLYDILTNSSIYVSIWLRSGESG